MANFEANNTVKPEKKRRVRGGGCGIPAVLGGGGRGTPVSGEGGRGIPVVLAGAALPRPH